MLSSFHKWTNKKSMQSSTKSSTFVILFRRSEIESNIIFSFAIHTDDLTILYVKVYSITHAKLHDYYIFSDIGCQKQHHSSKQARPSNYYLKKRAIRDLRSLLSCSSHIRRHVAGRLYRIARRSLRSRNRRWRRRLSYTLWLPARAY